MLYSQENRQNLATVRERLSFILWCKPRLANYSPQANPGHRLFSGDPCASQVALVVKTPLPSARDER